MISLCHYFNSVTKGENPSHLKLTSNEKIIGSIFNLIPFAIGVITTQNLSKTPTTALTIRLGSGLSSCILGALDELLHSEKDDYLKPKEELKPKEKTLEQELDDRNKKALKKHTINRKRLSLVRKGIIQPCLIRHPLEIIDETSLIPPND